jgi:predicted O-linked N-acetylglucosamine transferase (SPINDLY family)/glycosyltransferase involved in cell wall biosynthesis
LSKSRKKNKNRPRGLEALLALSQQATERGQPKKAMQYLREAVAQKPRDGRPYFFLGKLYRQAGQLPNALACYDKAMSIDPENPAVRLNRANVLQSMDRLDEARAAYEAVLAKWPGIAVGHFNLGVVLSQQGNAGAAATAFRCAAELQPDLTKAWHHLAKTLVSSGQSKDAIEAYRHLLKRAPDHVEGHWELGQLLDQCGMPGGAEAALGDYLRLRPDDSDAHYLLGSVRQQLAKFDEAVDSYRRSAELEPGQVRALAGLGNTLHQLGEVEQAAEQYRAALEIEPAFAHARMGATMSELPIIHDSEEAIRRSRERYGQALNELYEHYAALSEEERARAATAIGFLQPFYLSYQGEDVLELQSTYGRLLALLSNARYPEFTMPPPMPAGSEKIRLGVASGFLRNHSSWNIFQGLIEAIDRSRFAVFMFHTRSEEDRETRMLRHLCDVFVQGPMSTEQWAKTIRGHHLHALFFPEFGMDPVSIQLGCLRLAPIQLTSWGHPVTSGLETIDYYLSSDLMEPPEAQDHYSEKLVRLPNSSMHYRLPAVDPEPMSREDIDVPADAVVYWCCQSLFKYLPRHDDVFPRIAKSVPQAVFFFIGQTGGSVERQFSARMTAAFAAHGLDMDDHCHILEPMSKPVFAAMTAQADIFLDSIGWSGCNSAMEAIGADRPILTLPGRFMRARHCKSFLEIMGLDDWIAGDKEEFLDMAIRLGQSKDLREELSRRVRKRKARLYRDPEPVRGLETLLEEAVRDYRPPEIARTTTEAATTALAGDSADEHETLWREGVRLQGEGRLEQAAGAFAESLALSNPSYAAAESATAPALEPGFNDDPAEIELSGIRYPKIDAVSGDEPRPFWSVVIPVYNRDQFLLECLASVLAHWTGPDDMEIIVIDNGSEPSLEETVAMIGRGIVKYHRHPETIPLQANWNSAVRACRGRWIHLLHDDDYVLTGFYPALRAGLENCPDTVGAAFTAYENINERNEVIFRNRVFGSQRGIAGGWIDTIGVCNVLNPPAVVISREAYERVGGYSEDILYTTDWELYLRLVSFYDWWYEPEVLVHYRQHAMNVTTEQNRAGAQGEAFWQAIDMARNYLPLESRYRIVPRSRRYYFNWALERLRLPMLAGNAAGAMQLLREMIRIDRSDASLSDLFDWLGTTFAAPLWPAFTAAYRTLPGELRAHEVDGEGEFFDWLRLDQARETRRALADELLRMRPMGFDRAQGA